MKHKHNPVLIAMAVYDTEENGREHCTRKTLESLMNTVDLHYHQLKIVVNAATPSTKDELNTLQRRYPGMTIIWNPDNVGTARAVNQAWKHRKPGQHCIKMDNDVVIHQEGWVDILAECIYRDPLIGIIGLKRKDCLEKPSRTDYMASTLHMLPHDPGHDWLIVEKVRHVIGTCQMYSSALLDEIGYLTQPNKYGFDDSLAALRTEKAGYHNVFYPSISIDHIDPPGKPIMEQPYTQWKSAESSAAFAEYERLAKGYKDGSIPIWCDEMGNHMPKPE